MENTPAFTAPTAADYQALIDRISAALQSRTAGEIDAHAFRQCLDEIHAETRTLDLLRSLQRKRQRLAVQEQKIKNPRNQLKMRNMG
jgi:hypothetical protein